MKKTCFCTSPFFVLFVNKLSNLKKCKPLIFTLAPILDINMLT